MTIKEMLKKVEAYNEIAQLMGQDTVSLYIRDVGWHTTAEVKDIKSYKKFVTENYIKCVAEAILNYKDYDFKVETADLLVHDQFGGEFKFYLNYWVE